MDMKARIVTLVADKVAERYLTGRDEIVSVSHNGRKITIHSNDKKATRKRVPEKLDGIKIRVRKTKDKNPTEDLVA